MLKGHVFNLQTFTSEAFALFIDKFLNGRSGVAKGCELSNTANSATIADGFFVVRGRFLEVISGVTVSDITNDGFYSLICEIDLNNTNTVDQLNQATIKVISDASAYPVLTQQDITGDGKIYQYEFARFKVESGSITNFVDKRTFVEFTSIYDVIQNEAQEVINDIEKALQNVLDGSAYLLKTIVVETEGTDLNDYKEEGRWFFNYETTPVNAPPGVANGWLEVMNRGNADAVKQIWYRYGTANHNDSDTYVRTYTLENGWSNWVKILTNNGIAVLSGNITLNNAGGSANVNYPNGFTKDNCVVIACGITYNSAGYRAFGTVQASVSTGARLNSSSITVCCYPVQSSTGSPTGTFNYKLVLMKIS